MIARVNGMKSWLFLGGLLFSVVARAELGPQRLLLIGGGPYPVRAKEIFCAWAGGREARLLLFHWASRAPLPEKYTSRFHDCVGSEDSAPDAASVGENLDDLVAKIKNATAIFFTGGSQKNIMEVFEKHTELAALFRTLYDDGIPFGGTSAGTAIMSATMITGDGPDPEVPQDLGKLDPAETVVSEGLGLLPLAVLDQHFFRNQRIVRAYNVLLQKRERLVVGIDEGASAIVEGNRHLTVVGGKVMAFHYEEDPKDGTYRILDESDRFDLVNKRRLPADLTKKY